MLYCKDVFRDLGVVKVGTGNSAWADATITQNTTNINNYFDTVTDNNLDHDFAELATLYVPNGYFLINGTIGRNTGVVVSGYNNNQPIRILPRMQQILMGGGITHQRSFAGSSVNKRGAGILWAGPSDQPMIRIGEVGNRIIGSLWGYPYLSGNYSAYPAPLCRAGVEMYQIAGLQAAGDADISGQFTGFQTAIRSTPSNNHCDHLMMDRLLIRDCDIGIQMNNSQSVNWVLNWLEFYVTTRAVQSIAIDVLEGGKLTVNNISLTGDRGVTMLKTGITGANVGSFVINNFNVDRAISNATQASAAAGYLRLHEHTTNSGFFVSMKGHLSFSSGGDPNVANWPNYYNGVDPREPLIKHATASTSSWRRMTADVWGMDYANNDTYRNYEYRGG